jgi:transposase
MGGKTKPPYPREFREEAVRLLRSGSQPEELGRELGVTGQTLRDWLKRADLDAGLRTDGLTSDEREELRQLRRRVHRLEQEKEILKPLVQGPNRFDAHRGAAKGLSQLSPGEHRRDSAGPPRPVSRFASILRVPLALRRDLTRTPAHVACRGHATPPAGIAVPSRPPPFELFGGHPSSRLGIDLYRRARDQPPAPVGGKGIIDDRHPVQRYREQQLLIADAACLVSGWEFRLMGLDGYRQLLPHFSLDADASAVATPRPRRCDLRKATGSATVPGGLPRSGGLARCQRQVRCTQAPGAARSTGPERCPRFAAARRPSASAARRQGHRS